MKKLLVVIAVLLVAINGYGQGGPKIKGRVLDGETGKPVYNAQVTLFKTDIDVYTNYLGYFEISAKRGFQELIVSHISYVTTRITASTSEKFEIQLTPKTIVLPFVNLGHFIDNDSIEVEYDLPENLMVRDSLNFPASYTGGWTPFFSDLGEMIVNDPNFSSHKAEGNITFTISENGELIKAEYDGTENEGIVLNALSQLKDWIPAHQNNIATEQHFKLPIYYSSLRDEVFQIVEDPTFPPGGYQAFYMFIAENIQYPAEAMSAGIEGKVYVQFVVNQVGELTEIEVVKGIGGGCDEEAIRVISISPKWKPALQRGKPVKQRIILPVTFRTGGTAPKRKRSKRKQSQTKRADVNIGAVNVRPTLPEYPGGELALNKFLKANTKSIDAPMPINKHVDAVIVGVTVLSDGQLINPRISEGLGEKYDAEALRLVNLMPQKWIPGTKNGKVSDQTAYFSVPFAKVGKAKKESAFKNYSKGVAFFARNDYSKALGEFNKAIEKHPSEFKFYYSRGVVYLEQYQNRAGCADLTLIKHLDETAKELYDKFCVGKE